MIAAALALALAPCPDLPGVEALWARPSRWIVAGESHGTAEAPAAYAELVCHAGDQRPVVAAVEQLESDQPLIDAWIASDGGEAAKAALLEARMWTTRDGRSSLAYLALFERLRLLVREGRVRRVVAFQPAWTGPFDPARYEVMMAERLRAASPDPSTRVVVLVGNVHAMLREVNFGGTAYMPAAGLLPSGETLTLNLMSNGGAAWNCTDEGCGAHDGAWQPPQRVPRGIVLGGDTPWSGTFYLGVRTTASPPAL
ncbi:hypothetical protein OF829_14030 [Sphingomonas sp. LB-2]|uniref:hypothetical protein n=1 Tax=Sphingomonas caeni TaxID=2984949 RepID=UPI002232BF44|nr:hypothetical protein [Sphingomonas caeni]MCW3848359.1 hypothetical protein [Sphingomonas caeni]